MSRSGARPQHQRGEGSFEEIRAHRGSSPRAISHFPGIFGGSQMKNINVQVDHVTRVEGHGNIIVNVKQGKIEECKWEVVEAPRFFEAFVRGRNYPEISHIVSRICGICS